MTPDRTVAIAMIVSASCACLVAKPVQAAWLHDGNPLTTPASKKLRPRIVPDGTGGAYIGFVDVPSGNNRIRVQRILSTAVANHSLSLDTAGLTTGIYWVRTIRGTVANTSRFVIAR